MSKRSFNQPRTNLKLLTRNFSKRGHPVHGSHVLNLAVHTTESTDIPNSLRDVEGVWGYFENAQPNPEASSHYLIDSDGQCWYIVREYNKSWTIGAANSFTINYEIVGAASWGSLVWSKQKRRALKKLAQCIAYDSKRYGLPIQKGAVTGRNGVCCSTKKGVIRHSDVTKAGFGSHTDPGRWFPLAAVLTMARWYAKNGWVPGPAK